MCSVIVLIIASRSDIYDLFLELWREKIKCWNGHGLNSAVHYRFFFVFTDPLLSLDVLCKDDCIYCKCEESLEPGILLKTMIAIRYCENELEYDFILRTNLSSFWNFSVLSLEITSLNFDISIGTIFFQYIDRNRLDINPRWKDYLERIDSLFPIGYVSDVFYFLDGAGFILSREMIRLLLLPFPMEHFLDIPDDVAISILLFYRILVCNIGRVEIKELLVDRKWIGDGWEDADLLSLGFVRNKNGLDRCLDVLNYIHLVNHYYLKN